MIQFNRLVIVFRDPRPVLRNPFAMLQTATVVIESARVEVRRRVAITGKRSTDVSLNAIAVFKTATEAIFPVRIARISRLLE
jgi:hypothetical protein